MEKIIDGKLKEKFSEAQVDEFYSGFVEEFENYKTKNAEVVDTLMDFVDFAKFKATILEFKKGTSNNSESQLINHELGVTFNQDQYWQFQKEDLNDPDLGWAKKNTVDDPISGLNYVGYSRPMKNGLNLWRYDMTIKGVGLKENE